MIVAFLERGRNVPSIFKNSTFHIIEKGYHAPFRQEPQEFVGYVKEFFDKNPIITE